MREKLVTEILKNLCSELPLVSAIENNQYDLFVEVVRISKRKIYIDKNVTWVMGTPSKWPYGIFRTQFGVDNVDRQVRNIIRQIELGNAPRLWMTGPTTCPKDLGRYLESNGFIKKSEIPGMAVDLMKINTNFSKPPDLDIQIVSNKKTLYEWVRIVSLVLFGFKEDDIQDFFTLIQSLNFYHKLKFYIGFYEGKAVASSTLFLSNGIAGIYHMATLPVYRNKGIGTRMTLTPLLHARDIGYRVGVLQATPLGERIYKKIGFEEYCRLGRYRYEANNRNRL